LVKTNIAVQIYFKNILFLVWVPNSEEKKNKSQKTVPGSVGEDRGVALIRR
jgi:hypothetical protein